VFRSFLFTLLYLETFLSEKEEEKTNKQTNKKSPAPAGT